MTKIEKWVKLSVRIFVGTSGWYYDWNEDGSLDWYLKNSGLNAIELNASFYRFPFPNQVKAWARKGRNLRWVIKVNRLITHQFKFSQRALEAWFKFAQLFSPMDGLIDYFLFQLPPNFTPRAKKKIEEFIKELKITKKIALEVRNEKWFNKDALNWAKNLGITWVSIDAPEFSRDIYKTTENVYLRMHGRDAWYSHNYTNKELKEIARRIILKKPEGIYVFFNNNHNMLKNAQEMFEIFASQVRDCAGQSTSPVF